jgi:hypothetical protein
MAGKCTSVLTNCPGTTKDCSGGCVNTNADPLNCGDCGIVCAPNQLCVAGGCQDYFTAPCTSCPCAACGSAHACCTSPSVYCVAGGHCAG